MSGFPRFPALAAALLAATTAVAGYTPSPTNQTDAFAAKALANLKTYSDSFKNQTCTVENAAKRREWGDLSVEDRMEYTDAVLCLMSKPSRISANTTLNVPGAKTRYDDFVVPHINQTQVIHETANFLSWHRYFTWTYERALRDECGYSGYQPYWNWAKYAHDPVNSPVFDGTNGSMSGNGVYEAHNCTDGLGTGLNCIPAGDGGGCVDKGPFKNYTVNLGPISHTLEEPEEVDLNQTWAWNPRCLKRDVSQWVASRWTSEQNVTDLIAGTEDVASFQITMQGNGSVGDYGVHGGGHYTIGGDPGGDFYVSPGDPTFYLHHGMIDRTWWVWQNQDPANRTSTIAGTVTLDNDPVSRDGTLQDTLDVGAWNGPELEIELAMSTVGTTGGPFCYIYV